MNTIFADRELSRLIERAESRANAACVESHAAAQPESGAEWIDVGGTFAMFDGAESPLTQTFGLGLFSEPSHDQLDELERFFTDRGAAVMHEVSPLADLSLLQLLPERGYRPIELSTVLYRSLGDEPEMAPGIATRVTSPDEKEIWARASASGWATEMDGLAEFMFEFGKVSAGAKGGFPYVAEIDGETAAAGMLFIYEDVAILAGASTVPEFRRRGAQSALLAARLNHAATSGCAIAMMAALPGSQSQRNSEKNGFRVAYTRTKWMKS